MSTRSNSSSMAGPVIAIVVIVVALLLILPPWGKKELPPAPPPKQEKPAVVKKPIIVKIEKLEKIGHINPYWQVQVKFEDGGIEVLRLDDGLQTAVKQGSTYEVECTGSRTSLIVTQSYRYIKKIVREIG